MERTVSSGRRQPIGKYEDGLEAFAEDALPFSETLQILFGDPVLPLSAIARCVVGELPSPTLLRSVRIARAEPRFNVARAWWGVSERVGL